ncbi:hypothetical protein E1A91_A11G313800v1 [Gossypium mustelinum]|uniref:Uncharacterized protein n=2 Tax=Gossypium TaxID=3633 RepID=A0A5D2XDY5_GOSMU|nr:hypothetical protein ES288_A11G332200v1 [Gossypium darwinii]TYJ11952.1 hypothetical protein E1A91_A11G313800v1 [Gossypium mustelinum]
MFSQLIHSFSPLHQTPALSKVPCAMATDDMSTTPVAVARAVLAVAVQVEAPRVCCFLVFSAGGLG